jgi:hypothetical protein
MEVNARATLKRLQAAKKAEREKTSLFLDGKLYREFKKICGDSDIPVSAIIEDYMRNFVESFKKSGG